MAADYAALKAQVIAYSHRTDLDPVLDDMVELTRTRINRDLRVAEMITELTFTPTSNPWPLPADFLELRDIYFNDGTQRISVQLVGRKQLAWYSNTNAGSRPRFASIDGKSIEFAPGGQDREYTILYYAAPQQLVNDTDTTPTLVSHGSVWLHGTLIEVASYTQDAEIQSQETQVYTSEVDAANTAATESESGPAVIMQGSSNWYR